MQENIRVVDSLEEGAPRRWWLGLLFSGIWLFFLQEPFTDAWRADPTHRAVGLAALALFAMVYVVSFPWARHLRLLRGQGRSAREGTTLVATLAVLSAVTCWAVGQSGTATFVFVAVCVVQWFPLRSAIAGAVALVAGNEILVRVVPGWEEQPALTFAIATAAFAMLGFIQLVNRNAELLVAREENARLAVADERNRFARDLHDILGHSLTVITVKAELAGRLLDQDPERARAEMAEVERLGRDALADVRRAVGGYRELSLAGELARARNALDSAGIRADLPVALEEVPGELRELFAWTVREGVTNVIRHSGATRCTIQVSERAVRVEDDGSGAVESAIGGIEGHGLAGLRERAGAVGAVVMTSVRQPQGFRLEVTVP
ncbi:MAG: histidine kinase [Nocardioidaceae bacterium]